MCNESLTQMMFEDMLPVCGSSLCVPFPRNVPFPSGESCDLRFLVLTVVIPSFFETSSFPNCLSSLTLGVFFSSFFRCLLVSSHAL